MKDDELLNSYNVMGGATPEDADVVVIGGGIHSLIYAIHAKKLEIMHGRSKSMSLLSTPKR